MGTGPINEHPWLEAASCRRGPAPTKDKKERRWCMSGEPHFPVVVDMCSHVFNPNKQLQKLISRKENPKCLSNGPQDRHQAA
jgi:hypothetical protein